MGTEDKSMTIAVGMLCTDGILLCADTEQTLVDSKFQRPKVLRFSDWLLVTGAGSSDYIRMAFDKLCERFGDEPPASPTDARQTVEKLMLEIHKYHIHPFHQVKHPNPPELSLIVGVRCGDGRTALIKAADTGVGLSEHFEVLGMGWHLFEYWAKYFFGTRLPMDVAGYFCLFILREVKDTALACGGSTMVCKIPQIPGTLVSSPTILTDQDVLMGFPQTVVNVLLDCADARKSTFAMQEFQKQVDSLKKWFEDRQNKVRAETTYTATAEMPIKIPPSS